MADTVVTTGADGGRGAATTVSSADATISFTTNWREVRPSTRELTSVKPPSLSPGLLIQATRVSVTPQETRNPSRGSSAPDSS